MKRHDGVALAVVCCMSGTAQDQLIDDFSGSLAPYTDVRILNNDSHTPVNVYAWEISGGALRLNN